MNIRGVLIPAGALACCALAHTGAAAAPGDHSSLDWTGVRSALHDKGFDFSLGYVSETASNVRGGDRELWRYSDQWTLATTFDLQTLMGLDQAQFRITLTDRNGRSLSADANLGSLQEVQEIYGRGRSWRWTQFWYEQKYLGGALDWKVGRLTESEDFAAFSCDFTNLMFCGASPGNIVVNYWYNWPVSQWATRLKASARGFGYVQLGAYEVNPSYLHSSMGLNLGEPSGATGVLVPVEFAWLPRWRGGLEGSYKFGAWYNSSRTPDVVDNTNGEPLVIEGGEPLMHKGAYGAYINFLQRLTAAPLSTSRGGLRVFLNALYADRGTSRLDKQIAAGLFYSGPLPARPADAVGLAIGCTHVNSRIRSSERLQNSAGLGPVALQGSEYVGEIFYNLHLASWLDVHPNIQYVHQPGGIASTVDDVILGLKLSSTL